MLRWREFRSTSMVLDRCRASAGPGRAKPAWHKNYGMIRELSIGVAQVVPVTGLYRSRPEPSQHPQGGLPLLSYRPRPLQAPQGRSFQPETKRLK